MILWRWIRAALFELQVTGEAATFKRDNHGHAQWRSGSHRGLKAAAATCVDAHGARTAEQGFRRIILERRRVAKATEMRRTVKQISRCRLKPGFQQSSPPTPRPFEMFSSAHGSSPPQPQDDSGGVTLLNIE